jgi:nucleoside transporter
MSTRFKLSLMMFLEFFIWGAWLPLIFGYLPSLGFEAAWQQTLILGAFNLSALVALFFSTQFADRNFAAEKFLAFSQLVGGAAMIGLYFIKKPAGDVSAPFWLFFGLMLVHCLFYVPTISITNSIAFANLRDPQKEFGPVRLWGTIGWIAAAWPFVFIMIDWTKVPAFGEPGIIEWFRVALNPANAKTGEVFRQATAYTFLASGVASLLLAAYSLVLPHTPPKPAASFELRERFAWLEAVKLLRHPFVAVLFFVTFIDAAVHQCYFFWTERFLTGPVSDATNTGVGIASNWAMPIMSVGQVAEIITMAVLGYVLKNLGWRYTMIIGILGHAGRFAAFAFLPDAAVAFTVNMLHGICYAFFFATVYIFIDEYFPKDARSSAQGLFNALILGIGPFVANFICAELGKRYQISKDVYDFKAIFLYPCIAAVVAALLLLLFFHPPAAVEKSVEESKELDAPPWPAAADEGTGIKGVGGVQQA